MYLSAARLLSSMSVALVTLERKAAELLVPLAIELEILHGNTRAHLQTNQAQVMNCQATSRKKTRGASSAPRTPRSAATKSSKMMGRTASASMVRMSMQLRMGPMAASVHSARTSAPEYPGSTSSSPAFIRQPRQCPRQHNTETRVVMRTFGGLCDKGEVLTRELMSVVLEQAVHEVQAGLQ